MRTNNLVKYTKRPRLVLRTADVFTSTQHIKNANKYHSLRGYDMVIYGKIPGLSQSFYNERQSQ